MLNLKYVADEKKLALEKFVDDVDLTALEMSKSGKTYKVGHDPVKFVINGLEVMGALTLYSRKTVYEDWQLLRSKGMEERGEFDDNHESIAMRQMREEMDALKQLLVQALGKED